MRSTLFYPLAMLVLGHLFCTEILIADDELVTYDTHIASILKSKCGTCHGDGKQESGLSVTSYAGLMKGSGSGQIVQAGRSGSSRLVEVIGSTEESDRMPPEGDRLSESQISLVKKWIDTGLRESAGSTVAQMRTMGFQPVANPLSDAPGAVPMNLPAVEPLKTHRAYPRVSLAASSRAPVLAASNYRAIELFDPVVGKPLGVLPFPEGEPLALEFSRSGRLLMAAGGKPVQSGSVVLFDVASGKRLASVAEETDAIMAADVSPDERFVAIGCTSRLVKIYSTQDGSLVTTIDKHTDWVTAVAYSPDGRYLVTGDRIGNIYLWDGESGGALLSFSAHKKSVRSLAWRSDSRMVASCGEDGLIVWWDVKDGWPVVQKPNAHAGGVLDGCFGPKGELASCGRDSVVRVWSSEGGELKQFSMDGKSNIQEIGTESQVSAGVKPLLLRVAITSDGTALMAGDSLGRLHRWAMEK